MYLSIYLPTYLPTYLPIYLSIYLYCIQLSAGACYLHRGLGADAATHHGRQVGDVGRGAGEPFASTRSPWPWFFEGKCRGKDGK